jgi:GNAT superfamily N-acetyltransferase
MECCGTEETSRPECITPDVPSFSYREVYDLLLSCGFELGDFDAWRGDIALRVRFGTAQIVCVRRDNRTVSTASILFSSDDSAYLGAVATDPAYRGQGLAGELVRYLTNFQPISRILCKPHRESFYISLGFTKNGDFNLCSFLK